MHQNLLSVCDVDSSFDWIDKEKQTRPFKDQVLPSQLVSIYPARPLCDQISQPTLYISTPQSRFFLLKLLSIHWLFLFQRTQRKQSIIIMMNSIPFFFFFFSLEDKA